MPRRERGRRVLGFVLEALDEIDNLMGYGYEEFAASLDRQRALAFCWIAGGSALKDYTRPVQLPARQEEPLSSPIRSRNRLAHQPLSQLDAALLWRVSMERVTELRAIFIGLQVSGSQTTPPDSGDVPRFPQDGSHAARQGGITARKIDQLGSW